MTFVSLRHFTALPLGGTHAGGVVMKFTVIKSV